MHAQDRIAALTTEFRSVSHAGLRRVGLVSTNAGGVADLLKSVATALDAVGSAFVQALTLRRGG